MPLKLKTLLVLSGFLTSCASPAIKVWIYEHPIGMVRSQASDVIPPEKATGMFCTDQDGMRLILELQEAYSQ